MHEWVQSVCQYESASVARRVLVHRSVVSGACAGKTGAAGALEIGPKRLAPSARARGAEGGRTAASKSKAAPAKMRHLMQNGIINDSGLAMRTTVTIEDSLFEKALELADPDMDKAEIFEKRSARSCVFRRASASLRSEGQPPTSRTSRVVEAS